MNGPAWVGDAQGRGRIETRPVVSAHATGLLLGHGLFETMRVVPGARIPLWGRHASRLAASARALGLGSIDGAALHAVSREFVARVADADLVLRLTLCGGDTLAGPPRVVMTTRPFVRTTAPRTLALVDARRGRADPTAAHKVTARAFWTLAQREAERRGADEALVASDDGLVAETTTGNLFVLLDGRWVTPPADGRILPGVARAVVLDGLAAAGRPAFERPIGVGELAAATALAVTNAVHGPRAARLDAAAAPPDVALLQGPWQRALDEDGLRSGPVACR